MKKITLNRNLLSLALSAAVVSAMAPALQAGSASYTFDTDPSDILSLYGSASWVSTGGNPGGYLLITPAQGSQNGTIIFKDFDNGLVVNAFTFSADLKIGDGSSAPADGFSINFARATDPVLLNPDATADGTGFSGIAGGSGMPEEGTTTGLAIGFDAYQNGDTAATHGLPDGDVHYDTIGISVRVDNQLIFQKPLPTLNGASNDVTSLQTGPIDYANPGSASLLTWQPVKVELTGQGIVNIWWKGKQVISNLQTTFFPSKGQLVFSGRTGGNNQLQAVDNIQITTSAAAKPSVSNVNLNAFGLTVTLTDTPAISVNTNSIAIKLNGVSITPNSIIKNADVTTIQYNAPSLYPSGTTYPLEITFVDSTSQTNTITRDITVSDYGLVPASYAIPAANVDKTKTGFLIRAYQVASGQPNTIVWTEEQLDGLHGPNLANLTGADAKGYFTQPSVIDYKNGSGNSYNFPMDEPFSDLGIPGGNLTTEDNTALEILTFLEFPAAGIYTLGINSDDGYQLSAVKNPKDRFGVVLGHSDAVATATLNVAITAAGIYPFRLVYENGGGGAALEWYSILNQTTNTMLINDTATTGAIKAYRAASSLPVYVSSVSPVVNATGVYANSDIVVNLTDGDSATLDPASVVLQLNGQPQTITTTKAGAVTTIKAASKTLLPGGSTNTVTLVYGDNGTPSSKTTNQWTFQVLPTSTLPTDLVSPVGSGDSTAPGFKAKVYQVDENGTTEVIEQVTFYEQELAGVVGPNVADLTAASAGIFTIPGTINWSTTAGTASIGNFASDTAVPGLPGSANSSYISANTTAEILTYVEFPTAGYYILGVNSDDGFRVTATTNGPASVGALEVSAPASVAGKYYAVTAGRNQSGGIGLDITNAITGKLVYADPPIANADLNNAAEIKGNIALIDRGVNGFTEKLTKALNAGAIAVIIANNRDETFAEGIYPIVLGGSAVDIPAVMIGKPDGDKLKTGLSQGVTVSLTVPDYNSGVFEFDGTRGSADTLVGLNVTQAGVYPLRLVWFNAGGDGNLEFFSVASDGTKILINDPANSKSLKAYRTRTFTQVTKPTLSYTSATGKLTITYTGVLQSAATVNGPYTDVAGATSPATITTSTGSLFYRARAN